MATHDTVILTMRTSKRGIVEQFCNGKDIKHLTKDELRESITQLKAEVKGLDQMVYGNICSKDVTRLSDRLYSCKIVLADCENELIRRKRRELGEYNKRVLKQTQFTDIHWNGGTKQCGKSNLNIKGVKI